MTTKKHSLLDRKVLKDDLNDPMALLHPKNINKEMLLEYIRDACDYCTDYQVLNCPASLDLMLTLLIISVAPPGLRSQPPWGA